MNSCISKIIQAEPGFPYSVFLTDGTVITIGRTSETKGRAWLKIENQPELVPSEAEETVLLTWHMIDAGRSDKGGLSNVQIKCLGVPFPLTQGWPARLVGTRVSKKAYDDFMALRNDHIRNKVNGGHNLGPLFG